MYRGSHAGRLEVQIASHIIYFKYQRSFEIKRTTRIVYTSEGEIKSRKFLRLQQCL